MIVKPPPTSPAEGSPAHRFDQPPRWPWGRLWLLVIFGSLVVSLGGLAGLTWAHKRWPAITSYLVPNQSTVNTVERQVVTGNTIPSRVREVGGSLIGIFPAAAENQLTTADLSGLGVVLSRNGWIATLKGLRADDSRIVFSANILTPSAVLVDPASHYEFMTAGTIDTRALDIVTADDVAPGDRVWVVDLGSTTPVFYERRLAHWNGPVWAAADRFEEWWTLDAPVAAIPGAAVVTDRGDIVGLIDREQRVWPADTFEPILADIIQNSLISRPRFGWRYLDSRQRLGESEGMLLGAGTDQVAVEPGSPAEAAGLKAGDVLVSANGRILTGSLRSWILSLKPGQSVTLRVKRGAEIVEIQLTVGTLRE